MNAGIGIGVDDSCGPDDIGGKRMSWGWQVRFCKGSGWVGWVEAEDTSVDSVCEVCMVGAEYFVFAGSSWVLLELEGPGCLVGWGMQH